MSNKKKTELNEDFEGFFLSFKLEEILNKILIILSIIIFIIIMIFHALLSNIHFIYSVSVLFILPFFIVSISLVAYLTNTKDYYEVKGIDVEREFKEYFQSKDKSDNQIIANILSTLEFSGRDHLILYLILLSSFGYFITIEFIIIYIINFFQVIHFYNVSGGVTIPLTYQISLIYTISVNLLLYALQLVRFLKFKAIRYVRSGLKNYLKSELEEIENELEDIIAAPLDDFKINENFYQKIYEWKQFYSGNKFKEFRKVLPLQTYQSLFFTIEEEIYYLGLFTNFKSKIKDYISFNKVNQQNLEDESLLNEYLNIIENSRKTIKFRIYKRDYNKNKKFRKLKILAISAGLIEIPIGIIVALLSLLL